MWEDIGPASQGKIITAVLQDDPAHARDLLQRWSLADLRTLGQALRQLGLLVHMEESRRVVTPIRREEREERDELVGVVVGRLGAEDRARQEQDVLQRVLDGLRRL